MAKAGKSETEKRRVEVEERKSPSGKIVYASILLEAKEELKRPSRAIFWSGLAAGLSMGFSVLGVGLLEAYLPAAPWSRLVSRLGYSLGFLIVILGRQQLFTENTLTPVLELLRQWNAKTLWNVMRLWGVVLVADPLGAWAVSLVMTRTSVLPMEVLAGVMEFSEKAMGGEFFTVMLRGVFAGWLIAMIVWLLPFAEAARIWVIIILTYVVALAGFPHVIAGAVEVFSLAWTGRETWWNVTWEYLTPTLVGNVIGGVTLVAAIGHAQVLSGGNEVKGSDGGTGLP